MDHTEVKKDQSEANRVLEYYKKYCQNPDLIKYFTGPEASLVEKHVSNFEIREDVKVSQVMSPSNVEVQNTEDGRYIIEASSCNSQEIIPSPASLDIEIKEIIEIEEKNNSRSSSAASNKIEWDNGADIGYSNSYKLSAKKSASFPSLLASNVSVERNSIPTVTHKNSISENIKEVRKMYHQLTFSSETSNSTNKDDNLLNVPNEHSAENSSSQANENLKTSIQYSSSDNFLKRKIGDPVAYSTPHEASTSKESNSKSSGTHEGSCSTSQSSTEYKGYTVTPMLTLPITKRKLNDNKPMNLSERQSMKGHDAAEFNKNLSQKKVVIPNFDKIQKIINLCLTKPISLECISLECKESVHKVVQTSFSSENSSKSVQTEELQLENMEFEPVPVCTPLTQKIEYVRFASENSLNKSDKSEISSDNFGEALARGPIPTKGNFIFNTENSGTSKKVNLPGQNSKTTQTDPLMNEKLLKNIKTNFDTKEPMNYKNKEIGKGRRTRKDTKHVDSSELSSSVNSYRRTPNDKTSTSENVESSEWGYKTAHGAYDNQSEELLLTEMISLNHSKDLNTDIKRSIDILQKLLKSRKYDEATKKHYIKKIVQKIVDSKYSDDSTNSDLFKPKKISSGHQFVHKTGNQTPNFRGTTQLMDNKPWCPAFEPIHSMSKAKSKKFDHTSKSKREYLELKKNSHLSTKIDSHVVGNATVSVPFQKEAVKIPETQVYHTEVITVPPADIPFPNMSTFDKFDSQTFKQKVKDPETNENVTNETPRFTSNSSSRLSRKAFPDKENRPTCSEGKLSTGNWRTSKTLSEKLLENRDIIDFKNGQGDYLLNVVKNERYHQLSWINNEIEHLVQLKELLEKKPKSVRPESQLKDVISSLLKLKVGDMQGLSKNFEVLICESGGKRQRCKPDCSRMEDTPKSKRKSASLTPDYYTIETQLDPNGHLLDLTVYDGNGKMKYNYRSDGIVEDVSIHSKNHNTEVKLRPKTDEALGQRISSPHNVCRYCERMFIQPASDSDVSLCKECGEDTSVRKHGTSKKLQNNYMMRESSKKLSIPPKIDPNSSMFKNLYEKEPQSEGITLSSFKTEECEGCGRLFVRQDSNSELCLCENCEEKLFRKGQQSYQHKRSYKFCRVCGENFLTPTEFSEKDICEECLQFLQKTEMKCACQKVNLSDPLEFGACECVTKDSPSKENEHEWFLKNEPEYTDVKSFKIVDEVSSSEFCPDCERHISQCICGPKFLPKVPKLVGNEDSKEINVSGEYSYANCIGVQTNSFVTYKSAKSPMSPSIHQKKQSKPSASDVSRSKRSINDAPKSQFSQNVSRNSGRSVSQPSSLQSSRESLKSTPRRVMPRSQHQAKKDKCCKACLKCVRFSSMIPPKRSTIPQRSKSPTKKVSPARSPRVNSTNHHVMEKGREIPAQIKSCQCCTCSNCGIQTKKLGDKNVRCQCCICENCGIQVTMDANSKKTKIINSKWCQPKHSNMESDKKIPKKTATDKKEHKNKELNIKKNSVNRKRDELDHSDESLQSISSGNIICITPTKYKDRNNENMDSECQCVILNNRTEHDTDQHKSLQMHPSVLKVTCKSVNTMSNNQDIMTLANYSQSASGTSDSFVCITIPRGIQCSDREFDYESKRTSKSFFPQICFFSPPPPSPPCPPCRPPCPPPCRSPCPSPCNSPCPPPGNYPCPSPCNTPCPTPCRAPCPPPCRSPCPSPCNSPCPPPCRAPCPPLRNPPCPTPCRAPCPPPCNPPCPTPCIAPCPPPCRSPCPSPCNPPCPPPCRAPCPPPCRPSCPPPCRLPCIPSCRLPCPPPCKNPCPSPCNPLCPPPPCPAIPLCGYPCLPPCRNPPCSPPCPPPCRPFCPPLCQPSCPPPCMRPSCRSCAETHSPPCSKPTCSPPPICSPPRCPSSCLPPPPCKPFPPPCSPCPPPSDLCYDPPACPPPRCSSCCKPRSFKIFPTCTKNRPPKILSKPFPFGSRSKHSFETVCGRSPPCFPSDCGPPSRGSLLEGFFQNEQPPSAPPGYQPKAAPAGDFQFNSIYVPCKLCGIPPCAALSSMSCPICNQCKQKSRSEHEPLDYSPSTRINSNRTTNHSSKYQSKQAPLTHKCKLCLDTTQEDNSTSKPKSSDGVSVTSSLTSSTSSHSLPPDEQRSCESLEYTCKPLKPKKVDYREISSELTQACPSKKAPCPAKPTPCPGVGNKPCPAYPAKPCPNLKLRTDDERTEDPEKNSSETSLTCPSKEVACPAYPRPCPGTGNKPCHAYPAKPCPNRKESIRGEDHFRKNSKSSAKNTRESNRPRKRSSDQNRYAEEDRRSTQENEPILLPVSIQSTSPLQEVQNTEKKNNRYENSTEELQTQDEVPSMTSNHPENTVPAFTNKRQPDIQVFMCTAKNEKQLLEQKKCSCSLEMCKCSQTTTHEEKDVQCPASRQCTCQTDPKEDANVQCNCKDHAGKTRKYYEVNQDKDKLCPCKSSSSSLNTNSASESYMSCICCKKEKILKNLISKIPLCEPCNEVNQKNFYPHNYSNPQHSCLCYNLVNRDILYQFKQTLTELERLDIYQQYCEVLKNCKCCKQCGCKCQLPKKFKNGCAYFLKLEDACPDTHCHREGTNSNSSIYEEDEGDAKNYLPEVTVKVHNCKGACARKQEDQRDTKKFVSCPSIQNYLCTMKPGFIERAEQRRRILKDSTLQREENSESRKLKFIEKIRYLNQKNDKFSSETDISRRIGYRTKTYCVFDIELNESPKKLKPRVFKSFKEMKDLTRRKYLHLSEVKSKKNMYRERRLKEANRLLANTFTRRLQKSTLRGAVDIPLNVKVVSY